MTTKSGEKKFLSFNDVVVERNGPSLARLDVHLNQKFFLKVLADGIIISTASGSTAYSLSAGGSILHPQVSGKIMTPICSITTSIKPVVVPDFIIITIKASKDAKVKSRLAIDGHTIVIVDLEDVVTIRSSKFPMKFYVASNINPLDHWAGKLGQIYHYQDPI